ncbi:MAG: MarR family transcriptional regulator [Putridiphycobacter sp.]|nr:MarR family transcriptional regulator [Putridiphycobacter sp.]
MIPTEFHSVIIPWIGKTAKILEEQVDKLLAERGFDLTKMQFLLLHKLHENDGACQNDFAFMSNRNKSTLTRAFNLLEKKKYIVRKPSKEDKRMNELHLTTLGNDIILKTEPVFTEMKALAQNGLTETEIETVITVLKKVIGNLEQIKINTSRSN